MRAGEAEEAGDAPGRGLCSVGEPASSPDLLPFSSGTLGRSPAPQPRSCCPLISYMEHGGGVGWVGSSKGVLTSKALPSSDVPEPGSYEGSGGIHRKFCEIPVCFASEASGLSSPLWRGPDPPSPMHRCRISPSSIYPSPKGFLSVAAALRRGPARPGSLRAGGQDHLSL